MKIYHYHKKTGEFLGESDARIDPLETAKQVKGVYSLPGHSTFEFPPKISKNKAARRLPDDSGWEVVPDFRGEKYWLEDGTEIKITELGEVVPEDALNEKPPPPPPTEAEINEQKIQAKLRQMAIKSLQADNELPADFEG